MAARTNLVNLETVSKAYGTKILLDGASLGVAAGDRVGLVGPNGGGKSTLVSILAGIEPPDGGRVTHASGLRVGLLHQDDTLPPGATVGEVVLGDPARPEH